MIDKSMEDSFRVRVDKVFGSLSDSPSNSNSNSLSSSLWTLTDEEIEKKEWNRDSPIRQYDDVDHPQRPTLASADSNVLTKSPSNLGHEEDEDLPSASSKRSDRHNRIWRASANQDNDEDVELELRASIGLDSTLDFEEEEDEFDKVAVGKEKSGERVYMKDINDYGVDGNDYVSHVQDYVTDVNTSHHLPVGLNDVSRDPRANHLAAKLRLKEDSEAAGGINSLKLSETSQGITNSLSNAEADIAFPPDNIGSQDDGDGGLANPKPILKNNKRDQQCGSKSHKRVRFEPQIDTTSDTTRDQNQEASNLALTKTGDTLISSPMITLDRSKYTHYALDSSDEMDEEANRKAYMDFLNLIKKSDSTEMQLDDDFSKPPTFTPKKSSMVDRESKSKQNPGDVSNDRTFPISIAAEDVQDNKVSAMEEDDSPVVDKGMYKSGRQYRTKSKIDVE